MTSPYRIEMPHWPAPLWRVPRGTTQVRMQTLLARLGHPERRLPPVVHVAGTNGKGSTIAFLRAMAEAAGLRVHVYSSPHLHKFEERIDLCGSSIMPAELYRLLETCREVAGDDLDMTFFEGTTAAAFLAFAEHPADLLLLETGMGGRDDPTNHAEGKVLTILTPIDFDHTEHLGKRLEDIAAHKAGILRADVPCLVGPQPPEAMAVIEQTAHAIDAPLYRYGQEWAAELAWTEQGPRLHFADSHGEVLLPAPNLLGAHQASNAGAAVAAATLLDGDISAEAVEAGLRNAAWPGRLQRITQGSVLSLLPPGSELWMDGGHNPHGARAVAAHVAEHWGDMPFHLLFGTTRGKDVGPMLAPFLTLAASVTAIGVSAEPNAYRPEEIVASLPGVNVAPSLAAALSQADAPGRYLVFGSLYLWLECIS